MTHKYKKNLSSLITRYLWDINRSLLAAQSQDSKNYLPLNKKMKLKDKLDINSLPNKMKNLNKRKKLWRKQLKKFKNRNKKETMQFSSQNQVDLRNPNNIWSKHRWVWIIEIFHLKSKQKYKPSRRHLINLWKVIWVNNFKINLKDKSNMSQD